MYKMGIDLGGTKIEGIILDGEKEIFRHRIPTEQEGGYDRILENISSLYYSMTKEIGDRGHSLGLGHPGAISPSTGLMKNSNTQCLNGRTLAADLENKLERSCPTENDANCFALAEAVMGAGKGWEVVFGVIMGTGCGGGLIINNKIHGGIQSIGGEWGHMSLDPQGPKCYCGNRGCVETYISGSGVQNLYEDRFGKKLKSADIFAAGDSGDKDASEVLDVFYTQFGRALANLISILDPDGVVLGGGLSHVDGLYNRGISEVKKYVFNDTLETPIVKNKLGDSAGVIGAAFLGR